MKKLFIIWVILFVTMVPGSIVHAEDMSYQMDGLEQFRLNEDIVERVLATREDIKASNVTIAENEEFTSPADILKALDSSPEAIAILSRHGLTSKDALLFMAALARAMDDAEKQPTIDTSMSEDSLSPREANRIFYIRHKAEVEARLGPLEDEGESE
jgi:hypothetical protein